MKDIIIAILTTITTFIVLYFNLKQNKQNNLIKINNKKYGLYLKLIKEFEISNTKTCKSKFLLKRLNSIINSIENRDYFSLNIKHYFNKISSDNEDITILEINLVRELVYFEFEKLKHLLGFETKLKYENKNLSLFFTSMIYILLAWFTINKNIWIGLYYFVFAGLMLILFFVILYSSYTAKTNRKIRKLKKVIKKQRKIK